MGCDEHRTLADMSWSMLTL